LFNLNRLAVTHLLLPVCPHPTTMRLLSSVLALALPLAASARSLSGSLAYGPTFPDRSACPIGARALLDGGERSAIVRADGTFVLSVPPGRPSFMPELAFEVAATAGQRAC
jgi:hypothetical protein